MVQNLKNHDLGEFKDPHGVRRKQMSSAATVLEACYSLPY